MINYNFEEIRPYNDNEFKNALHSLLDEKAFMTYINKFFPSLSKEDIVKTIDKFNDINEFQLAFMFPALKQIINSKCESLTFSGIENITTPSLLMSNHRDIVIDPSFICMSLVSNGFKTCEIAIGDNLLSKEWIRKLVRVNKSFIVRRGLPVKEQPRAFMQLSSYIRHVLTEKKQSVWIAQREGRAKDSNDRTQESIIKMFALSGSGSFIDNLKSLNISPVTFSYEYDPCDYLKAKEFQQKRDIADFKKSKDDDIISMQTGIMGYKGNVHIHFSPSINNELDNIASITSNKKEQAAAVCKLCDKMIFKGYRIYNINRVAYDILMNTNRYSDKYTQEEYIACKEYFNTQLNKIELENKDEDFLYRKILEMYANPLINQLSVTEA